MSAALPPLRPSDGTNLYGQDTGREHLSHSALSSLLSCPQKYAFAYARRLELAKRPAPLSLGAAYQLAIEHQDPQVGADAIRAEARILSQADEDRVRVHETIVVSASALYIERFPPTRGALREFGYRVCLRNPWTGRYSRTYDLLGYADEMCRSGPRLCLVENKLVGQITEQNIRRLPLDRQIALASYGIWRATGEPVGEVAYRMMRKPSIKQRKGESVQEYCERLAEDYRTRPDFYCVETTWLRGTDDLVRLEAELWEWSRQLRDHGRANVWTRNTTQCAEYGGCAFLPLCLGEPVEGLYRVKAKSAKSDKRHPQKWLEAA